MNSDDIYVMPAFVTLAVSDLQASVRWYHDVLGFRVLFEVPGQLVHLRREKYQDLLLKPAASSDDRSTERPGRGVSLCYTVGTVSHLDRLAVDARSQQALILEGPLDRPWNVRELVLSDPDGYRVVLSGGPVEERRFDEIFPTTGGAEL